MTEKAASRSWGIKLRHKLRQIVKLRHKLRQKLGANSNSETPYCGIQSAFSENLSADLENAVRVVAPSSAVIARDRVAESFILMQKSIWKNALDITFCREIPTTNLVTVLFLQYRLNIVFKFAGRYVPDSDLGPEGVSGMRDGIKGRNILGVWILVQEFIRILATKLSGKRSDSNYYWKLG
ncbi:hypothetical protein C8F04DRAFT_1365177 [Mycena alexandri]|uniref:Uncharacterized protein n=1 Tax=Mycena alexandri TaxID=1745969 RepID=A0AAD6SN91_9AGAR|nr:hypothetical protein C8F04DRAFT_1365177 [Mycena alexandri]